MNQPRHDPAAIRHTSEQPQCGCLSNYADLCQHAKAGKSLFEVYDGGECACACHLMTCYEGMEPPKVRLYLPREGE